MLSGQPTFLGYLAKKVAQRPEWLKAVNVLEICSVSNCISSPPDNWIDHWTHNEAGFYNSPQAAWDIVLPTELANYTLFAYRIWPWRFDESGPSNFDPAQFFGPLPSMSDHSNYDFLGYDLIGRDMSHFFECSPLSCNGMAEEIPVNEHCLVTDVTLAADAGRRFGDPTTNSAEPGVYYIVEVLRYGDQTNVTSHNGIV